MIWMNEAAFKLVESNEPEDLKKALQIAMEFEHATMPPYLYAWYSLRSSNRSIRSILRGIVLQEMAHMLLAGNLLKAIGGTPSIYREDFVPDYPSPLPGSVANDLVVPLKPYSRELVEHVFMRIEEPELILDFPVAALDAVPDLPHTIGQFYRCLRDTFVDGGDDLIVDKTGETQPATFQLFQELPINKQRITSAAGAIEAIDFIVEQGEGTTESPFIPDGDAILENVELAHFYRFATLTRGRIKPNPDATPNSPPDERYLYASSDPVPFDEDGVIPFPANPKAAHYTEGTPERTAMDAFNRTYTGMLGLLQEAYSTDLAMLDVAITEMRALNGRARTLAEMNLGPSFEFLV